MPRAPGDQPTAAQRVLATAGELFYRQGARAVGVDEIVAKAGTTKPSLYRAFGSKDQLIAACLEDQAARLWSDLEAAFEAHAGDPRAQILSCFEVTAGQAGRKTNRGCALSNALVEFPEPKHPGRRVALGHKEAMRKRLRDLTRSMDARKPKKLADGLFLLMEGAFISQQIFGEGGPAGAARGAAEALIEAHTRRDVGVTPEEGATG